MASILHVAKRVTRILLGRQPAARGLTVFPDDVFLVSYPRSGNTWTRFLISNLAYPLEPTTFANLESRIPEIYDVPDRLLRRFPRPRIIKSHECFDPRYPKVIYLVRDPRDVAVSHYYFNVKKRNVPEGYPLSDYVEHWFLRARTSPQLGTWGENVQSWLACRQGSPNLLRVRYEDLLEDTVGELARIASFMNLEPTVEDLSRAVELSTADAMRAWEQRQSDLWQQTRGTRADIRFVRAARAGVWRSTLSAPSVALIEAAWGPLMRDLGYSLATEAAPARLSPSAS